MEQPVITIIKGTLSQFYTELIIFWSLHIFLSITLMVVIAEHKALILQPRAPENIL